MSTTVHSHMRTHVPEIFSNMCTSVPKGSQFSYLFSLLILNTYYWVLTEIEIALADQAGLVAALSRNDLRVATGIARASLDRALAELTAQHFIYCTRTKGQYVVSRHAVTAPLRRADNRGPLSSHQWR